MAEKKIDNHPLPNSAVSLLYGLASKVEVISKKRYRITKGEEHILELLEDSVGLSDPTIVDIIDRFFALLSKDTRNYVQSRLTNTASVTTKPETSEGFQTVTYRGKDKVVFRSSDSDANKVDPKKSQVLYRGRRIAQ